MDPRRHRAGGGERRRGSLRRTPWWAAGALLLVCSNAGAQTGTGEPSGEPDANWYVDLDAAYRPGGQAWTEHLSRQLYDETAAFDVRYLPSTGAAFGAGAGRRLWGALSIGIGVTYFRTATGTQVTGEVPHPLFVGRPRALAHAPDGVRFTELGVHLRAGWTLRVSDRVDITLAGGPSLFEVRRDRLTSIETSEVGAPYDQVTSAGELRAAARKRIPGVNASIDLTYYFARSLEPGSYFWKAGIGGYVRWAGGEVEPPAFGAERWTVGSWRGGLGFRFRF